jgi:hypothetical protein
MVSRERKSSGTACKLLWRKICPTEVDIRNTSDVRGIEDVFEEKGPEDDGDGDLGTEGQLIDNFNDLFETKYFID